LDKGKERKRFKRSNTIFLIISLVIAGLIFVVIIAYLVGERNRNIPCSLAILGFFLLLALVGILLCRTPLIIYSKGMDVPMSYLSYIINGFNRYLLYEEIIAIYPYNYEVTYGPGMFQNIILSSPGEHILYGYIIETKTGKTFRIRSSREEHRKDDASLDTLSELKFIKKRYRKINRFMVEEMPPKPKKPKIKSPVLKTILKAKGTGALLALVSPLVILVVLAVIVVRILGGLPEDYAIPIVLLFLFISVIPALIYVGLFYKLRTKQIKTRNADLKYKWGLKERDLE